MGGGLGTACPLAPPQGPPSSLMFSTKLSNLPQPASHSPNNYCNIYFKFMVAGTPWL